MYLPLLLAQRESQNYWNPFRDWNIEWTQVKNVKVGLKTTETLLGIETSLEPYQYWM